MTATGPETKALVLYQPWATLIALGVKTIETRPSPPNGPMCPKGVRGYPGLRVDPGERIAIVAGKAWDRHSSWRGGGWLCRGSNVDGRPLLLAPGTHNNYEWVEKLPAPLDLPLGSIVCTVAVPSVAVMGGPTSFRTGTVEGDQGDLFGRDVLVVHDWPGRPDMEATTLVLDRADGATEDISSQLPFGLYKPGRAGWFLADPIPTEPIPCGRAQGVLNSQGIFRLPADVAAKIPAEATP